MQKFRGTGVALVTPFNQDLSVDFKSLSQLVEFNIENGIDYLVVLGTTAESATLTHKEKEQVKKCVRDTANGRVPLMLGIGGNNTQEIVNQVSSVSHTEGFDAILSVSPYYNRPTQEGIIKHFQAIAKASLLPVLLYNVPSRTGVNMLADTTLSIARSCPNVFGIKEAAGSMDQALRLLKDRPKDFLVISGDDMLALPMVSAGGDGVISVIAQALPEQFSKMIGEGLEGAYAKAYTQHYTLMSGIDLIFEEGNPAGIKSLLKEINLVENTVRLPLVVASKDLGERLRGFAQSVL